MRKDVANLNQTLSNLFLFIVLLSISISCKHKEPKYVETENTHKITIYTLEEVLTDIKKNGLQPKGLGIIDPICLIQIDSTLTKTLIDLEFKAYIGKKSEYNKGIYIYFTPQYTKEIATSFGDKYAVSKLYRYYKQLPKYIKSDTIYYAYSDLEEILSVFIKYKPEGLINQLKYDFYEWEKLSKFAQPKKYLSTNEYDSIIKHRSKEENDSAFNVGKCAKYWELDDRYPDCNLIAFQLACALKELKVKGFENIVNENLIKHKSIPIYEDYKLKDIAPPSIGNRYHKYTTEIKLTKTYKNLASLIEDISEFKTAFIKINNGISEYNISKIVHNDNVGFVETNGPTWEEDYRISLNDNNLVIEDMGGWIE